MATRAPFQQSISSQFLEWPIRHTAHPENSELNIIIVPDIAKPAVQTDPTWKWVESLLPNLVSHARVFCYQYNQVQIYSSIWRGIAKEGDQLLQHVLEDDNTFHFSKSPIIVFAHGFGGMIVKQALSLVFEQGRAIGNTQIWDALAGTVFFGTPHPTFAHPEKWSQLTKALRLCSNFSRTALAQAEVEATSAANISRRFQESQIDSTVLSIYETRETKFGTTFWKGRRAVLVDKSLAETSTSKEKLIPSDADHSTVNDITRSSSVSQEVGLLVQSALQRSMLPKLHVNVFDSQPRPDEDRVWASTISDAAESVTRDHLAPLHRISGATGATYGSSDPSNVDVVPVPTMSDYVEAEPTPKLPCYLLQSHARNPDFMGREDVLRKMDEVLLPRTNSVAQDAQTGLRCFSLCGYGGLGKTQVAIEFATTRKDQFDAVFWVHSDESAKIAEGFSTIATSLGLVSGSDASDRVVSQNKVTKWLSAPSKGPPIAGEAAVAQGNDAKWLLIFDNADDPALLHDYWPIDGEGAILVTSRDSQSSAFLRTSSTVQLEPLAPNIAAALLQRLTFREESEDSTRDAVAVSERLRGLPLAVAQAAAFILRREMTYKEFLDKYETTLPSFANMELQHQREHYGHTLATVWAFDDLSQNAMALVETLSFLDPDCIQEFFLATPASVQLLEGYPSSDEIYLDSRTELTKSSIVRRDKTRKELTLHRLVQDVTLGRMSIGRRNAVFMFATKVVLDVWPQDTYNFAYNSSFWPVSEQLLPHVLRLQYVYEKLGPMDLTLASKREFVNLLQHGAWYLQERGNFQAAGPLYDLALSICNDNEEDMIELSADIDFALANIAGETNEPAKTLQYSHALLRARIEIDAGKELPGMNVAQAYGSVAEGLILSCRYEEALTHCQQSLALYHKQPLYLSGEYYPHFPIYFQSLALAAVGRGAEALKDLYGILTWREERYGPNDTESFKYGFTQQVLGVVLDKLGMQQESFEACQKAIINYRATVGTGYHRAADVCVKLAQHHVALDQFEAASIYYDQALRTYSAHPYCRQQLARLFFQKQQFHFRQGDEASATQALSQAEELYTTLVPEDVSRPLTLVQLDRIVAPWVW